MGTITAINSYCAGRLTDNYVDYMVDGYCKQPGIAIDLFII